MLRAPGDRPLFTTQKPQAEALEWWRAHRNDALGKKVIDLWAETDVNKAIQTVADLDRALNESVDLGAIPVEVPIAPG